jgi:hypothetical protein
MSGPHIIVRDLCKTYRVPERGTGTLHRDPLSSLPSRALRVRRRRFSLLWMEMLVTQDRTLVTRQCRADHA